MVTKVRLPLISVYERRIRAADAGGILIEDLIQISMSVVHVIEETKGLITNGFVLVHKRAQ